jgi:chemotaxis protein CheD
MKPHLFFDREHATWVRRLLPGEFASLKKTVPRLRAHEKISEGLMTVLGSCVAVCLQDRIAGVIGMNHFMLPLQLDVTAVSQPSLDPIHRSARYGSHAMELLINEMLTLGARKAQLRAWVFGGGQILSDLTDVGQCNVQFAAQYLQREEISIKALDTGGNLARRLFFAPHLDSPVCRLIKESLGRVQHREARHAELVANRSATMITAVNLFGRI